MQTIPKRLAPFEQMVKSDLKAKIENNEIKKESLSLEQLNDLNFFYAVNIKKKQQINRVKKEKLLKMRENEI